MISYDKHVAIRQMRLEGFSQRETAKILGISRTTVAHYWRVEPGEVKPLVRKRSKWSDGLEDLIRELYFKHRNCDVLRRELEKLGKKVPGLRSIQQTVKPLRNELKAQKAKKARSLMKSYSGD